MSNIGSITSLTQNGGYLYNDKDLKLATKQAKQNNTVKDRDVLHTSTSRRPNKSVKMQTLVKKKKKRLSKRRTKKYKTKRSSSKSITKTKRYNSRQTQSI